MKGKVEKSNYTLRQVTEIGIVTLNQIQTGLPGRPVGPCEQELVATHSESHKVYIMMITHWTKKNARE